MKHTEEIKTLKRELIETRFTVEKLSNKSKENSRESSKQSNLKSMSRDPSEEGLTDAQKRKARMIKM